MALLNPNHLKTLVAIGLEKKKKFFCDSTGFLVGFIAKNSKYPEKRTYWIFLVTNKHVFEERNYVDLRFNRKHGKAEVFRQGLFFPNSKEPRWLGHKNQKVDLALLNVSPKILEQHNIDWVFFNEEMFAYFKNFKKIGIEIGDEVYILGFPLTIAGKVQNYPCVKSGTISRLDKEVLKENKSFWIDSSIFPGSSGSPIILKPSIHSLTGTKAVSRAYLLGVVSGYIPYEERLYTFQTKPPSVVSLQRENSGLSFVVPMDFVRQIFKNWIAEKKKLERARKQIKEPLKVLSQIKEEIMEEHKDAEQKLTT